MFPIRRSKETRAAAREFLSVVRVLSFRSYRRFLCLRAPPCTSSIHTISRSAWCSSAYPRVLRRPLPPRPPASPPFHALHHVLLYIKIRALKTRRYTKSTPFAASPSALVLVLSSRSSRTSHPLPPLSPSLFFSSTSS